MYLITPQTSKNNNYMLPSSLSDEVYEDETAGKAPKLW